MGIRSNDHDVTSDGLVTDGVRRVGEEGKEGRTFLSAPANMALAPGSDWTWFVRNCSHSVSVDRGARGEGTNDCDVVLLRNASESGEHLIESGTTMLIS